MSIERARLLLDGFRALAQRPEGRRIWISRQELRDVLEYIEQLERGQKEMRRDD